MAAEMEELVATAERIVAGDVSPYLGAAHIWRVIAEANYEGYEHLRIWAGLAGEWQDKPEHREGLDADIRDEAKVLLAQHAEAGRTDGR